MNNPAPNYKIHGPERCQFEFQFACLDTLIPEDHRVRAVWDFVQEMDTSFCFDGIKTSFGGQGRSATCPKILLTLWIYSLMEGNASARKLEDLCENHNVYKWIVGGAPINRTMLAEFRSKNPFKFEDLLASCLAVMLKHEVIKDEDFAQDGTRVKANAGFNSFRRKGSLGDLKDDLKIYIKQLTEEIEASKDTYEKRLKERRQRHAIEKHERVQKALDELKRFKETKIENAQKSREKVEEKTLENLRVSSTDQEARKMKMGDGGYRLAYNVQFATGLDSRVIFGVDVVNTLDPGTAPRMIGKVQSLLKRLTMKGIRYWIGDSAYSSKEDVGAVAELYSDVIYFGPAKVNKGVDPKKHLKNDSKAVKQWRDRIDNKEVNEMYKKRCSTAEFSNAQVKNHGFTQFFVRSLEKVKGAAILQAMAHNIQRFLNLISKASLL
jgi:transposase